MAKAPDIAAAMKMITPCIGCPSDIIKAATFAFIMICRGLNAERFVGGHVAMPIGSWGKWDGSTCCSRGTVVVQSVLWALSRFRLQEATLRGYSLDSMRGAGGWMATAMTRAARRAGLYAPRRPPRARCSVAGDSQEARTNHLRTSERSSQAAAAEWIRGSDVVAQARRHTLGSPLRKERNRCR